jgi:hypothetical protein
MDLTVTRIDGATAWDLIDLLGRSSGCVVQDEKGFFRIHPAGQGSETMRPLTTMSYNSLDDALAAIETETRGVCRREPSAPGAGKN